MKTSKNINIIDFVISFLSIASIVNVLLLLVGKFSGPLSLALTGVVLLVCFLVFRLKISVNRKMWSWLLIPILLLAFFLRIKPNQYITGGQDQGTYTSMAKQFQENDSLYIEDELREGLNEEARGLYDKSNVILGVELKDEDTSEYVMPFYPVMPSWVAIFGDLLGDEGSVYAITLFSLLSILGAYLLAYEISGKEKVLDF